MGVGSRRIARSRDGGPGLDGVKIRYVRVVSMGERRIDDRAKAIPVKTKVVVGEVDVRISGDVREGPSSGRPTMADRRLRINVLSVGNSRL